jgi:GWxTD domain-containing protein
MKQLVILIFLIHLHFCLPAKINFIADYAIFMDDEGKPYVEFYLSINGNMLNYVGVDENQLQAATEITVMVENEEQTQVIAYDKYQLNSPLYNEGESKIDLSDLKRLSIPRGNYKYTIKVKDLNDLDVGEITADLRPIDLPADEIAISEVQLGSRIAATKSANAFSKFGHDIFPSYTHYYGGGDSLLVYLFEIYNTTTAIPGEAFLSDVMITLSGEGEAVGNFRTLKRHTAAGVIPVVQTFDLSTLPSGRYELAIFLRNRQNEVLASRRVAFQRNNPELIDYSAVTIENTFVDSLTNIEELKEYIRSLAPISSASEYEFAKNQLKYADLYYMQQFFLNFWKSRNALSPEEEWLKYKKEVEKVNEMFGYGNIKGYQTERGRVYLQYGPPSAMQDVPYQRDTYPYSIWQYYKLNGLVDRKFVFYSPSMEMMGYQVLHSNVPGEVRNPYWEQNLLKSNGPYNTTQENPYDVDIQPEAKDLYDNPR